MEMSIRKMMRLSWVMAAFCGISVFASESVGELINISTRGKVGSEPGQELIAGFVIREGESRLVLVRGVGPDLVEDGLSSDTVLEDPVLVIVRHLEDGSVEVVGQNDDWAWDKVKPAVVIFPIVGGFRRGQSLDAELAIELEPGIYSVIVSGKGGEGIVLVEVYSSVY